MTKEQIEQSELLRKKFNEFKDSDYALDLFESKWQEAIEQEDMIKSDLYEQLWDKEYQKNHTIWMELVSIIQKLCNCNSETAHKMLCSDRFEQLVNKL